MSELTVDREEIIFRDEQQSRADRLMVLKKKSIVNLKHIAWKINCRLQLRKMSLKKKSSRTEDDRQY